MPPIIPIGHYRGSNTNNTLQRSNIAIPCYRVQGVNMLETLEFPQSKRSKHINYTGKWVAVSTRMHEPINAHPTGGPTGPSRNTTTSSLTTATLTYAIGAGVTAAAGTRLALQSILSRYVIYVSFQLQDNIALYCYLLSLPPCIRIG